MTKVYWITGLAGVGKTPLAQKLTEKLLTLEPTILLDGDDIRDVLNLEIGNDKSSRLKTAYIYSNLIKLLESQNINIVCSTISLFHEIHKYNRNIFSHYCEILIQKDLDKLIFEDKKSIYSNALKNNDYAVGINIQPEYPENPSLVFNFNKKVNLDKVVDEIINFKI